ncbi:mediator of RNA polymerase II transcription subunit 23 [Anastrepha ludens]|uniref:mediator of RNA polymerase II transcription subunit 23 n=1 Tax=Anastrepha ludens TaxID=28586 RepID=UPI0023B1E0EB|nr:mediator of RNA polymerase II transcription subunit 23 [Anastrepha ludens]
MDTEILEAVNSFLKVEPIEEAFLSVIVYKSNAEEDKASSFTECILRKFEDVPQDNKEGLVRQYLQRAATATNISHLRVLMNTLSKLAETHAITARMLCDKILLCDRLVYENANFWVESFKIIKRVLSLVDYKGVREIMKMCRDKAQTFPVNINVCFLPQLQALRDTLNYIFDRNNCLLPGYFIANEIMKPPPYHWTINKMMTDFMEEFRRTAQMVSIIGHSHMLPIVECFGYADHMMNSWKLDPNTLRFVFKGNLPYDADLLEEQTKLLRYVLDQPYSKEMVSVMMSLQKQQKQRCNALEEQLVNLIISAMEMTESNDSMMGSSFNVYEEQTSMNEWVWLHLSSQLIYFVLFQFVSFSHIVTALYEKLSKKELRKGRDQLMWILLQFISGSIQKNPIANFLPTFKLFDLLYPEQEPLKLPDCTKSSLLRQMAPICIWIHLMKKARLENMNINRPLPIALKNHHDFLQHLVMPNTMMSMNLGNDFRIILICNAYSTNQEYFSRPMNILTEALNGNAKTAAGGQVPSAPFSMVVLDSLTVHSKMSLIHSFFTQMIKQAQAKSSIPAPALVETYARLLVYTEIESLGIKGFLQQLLPAVFKHQAWGILHTLLEMFLYRLHHIPTQYRLQLLSHCTVVSPQTNKMQLNLCFESTALRLITGLGSVEMQPQMSRYFSEKPPGSVASSESEELNRVLILTLARSMHMTGLGDELQPWCKELLSIIMQNTPHSWASHSLACFPPALNEFFVQNNHPLENKQLLKKSVEEEYRNWTSMSNDNDIMNHFIRPSTNPLFLCLLFKMIWETENVSPVAYKILEGISARALSAHLRKLCDYLVGEVANSNGKDFIHKCVDTINNMIWKYNIVTIDRVVLCLALRTQEGNEAQVCFLIIQLLLLKTSELRNRIQEFCKENHPDHWKQNNWHEKHLSFHQKYPEKFAPDESASHPPLPVYFSNVCLRFLPVLDIVVHRFIELPIQHVHQICEVILDHLSILYKFHDRPITYLYNTLHFYERILRERPSLKKKLVSAITGAFCDIRPPNWCVSEPYKIFMQNQELLWNPELNYYINLVRRLSDTITGKNLFFNTDWRFNEFPNAPAHALYVTCVELLSLPIAPSIVANNVVDVIVKGYSLIPQKEIHNYINAVGIILAALPETHWSVIYDRLQDALNAPKMVKWNYRFSAFELFNFKTVCESMIEKNYVLILAVAHSIFHHMGGFKLASMTKYIADKLKPCVRTEQQLVFLCHVFGPFLQRIDLEKPNTVAGIAIMIYEMLDVVDKAHGPAPLEYIDTICDFLYHIKYIHVGNVIKNESEVIIKRLRPALQLRLRFITRLNIEDINTEKNLNMPIAQQQQQQQQQQHQTTTQQQLTAVAQHQAQQLQQQQQQQKSSMVNAQSQQQQQQVQMQASGNAQQPTQQQQQQQQQLQQNVTMGGVGGGGNSGSAPGNHAQMTNYNLMAQQQQQQQHQQQQQQHMAGNMGQHQPQQMQYFMQNMPPRY